MLRYRLAWRAAVRCRSARIGGRRRRDCRQPPGLARWLVADAARPKAKQETSRQRRQWRRTAAADWRRWTLPRPAAGRSERWIIRIGSSATTSPASEAADQTRPGPRVELISGAMMPSMSQVLHQRAQAAMRTAKSERLRGAENWRGSPAKTLEQPSVVP